MKKALLLGLVAVLLVPSSAFGYVCTRVVDAMGQESGPSLSWFSRDVTFLVHVDGTEDIDGDEALHRRADCVRA